MFTFFHQLYPFYRTPASQVKAAAIVSVVVLFVLFVFQPFGLDTLPTLAAKIRITGGYAIVCFATVVFNSVWLRVWPGAFTESRWTVGKEILWILWNILSVGLANSLFGMLTGSLHGDFMSMLWVTFLVAILPVALLVSLNYVHQLRRNLQTAQMLNGQLHTYQQLHQPVIEQASLPDEVLLPSDEKNGGLSLSVAAILFLKADDNYVEVHYLLGKTYMRRLLRTPLKNVEANLEGFPQFLRCHRSYIVNLEHISSVQGNAQGARLFIGAAEIYVPVARGMVKILRQRMAS